MAVPAAHMRNTDGQPEFENHGTPPDIEVVLDPKAVREGHDPQLEKAVEVVLQELAKVRH
jgi:tricorn protease